MLFGSAHTLSGGALAPTIAETAHARTSPLEAEDIDRAPGRCIFLDVFHRAHDAQRCVRIVGRYLGKRDRSHPSADPGIDGDVLLAVRTEVGDGISDDARRGVELPEFRPRPRVDRLEPPVHRSVEHDIPARGEDAAVNGKPRILDAPGLAIAGD